MKIGKVLKAHVLHGLFFYFFFPSAAQANLAELAKDPQWLRLIHFKNYEGAVDSAEFYISKEGQSNPFAELRETVKAFQGVEQFDDPNENLKCRFPARYFWISSKLNWQAEEVSCPAFDMFRQQIRGRSLSVVFSSYYLNNPSSAFGHTFIRINKFPQRDRRGEDTELLDMGINFAANPWTSNPILYAVGGLAGWFKGTYSRNPYYYKVREYNDFESRDLWSYELDMSAGEIEQFIRHIWELGPTWYDYYFFSENCSYHILTALEAASPRYHFTKDLPAWVIPADTLKVLWDSGHVVDVSFRPSLRKQFRFRVSKLSESERKELEHLISSPKGEIKDKVENASKVRILDSLTDYIEMKYPKKVNQNGSEEGRWRQRVLMQRAKIPLRSPALKVSPDKVESPHLGHGSSRIGILAGEEQLDVAFRFAYHDHLDPLLGYPDSQIEMGNFTARYEQNAWYLQEFRVMSSESLSPVTRYEWPISWRMVFGGQRLRAQHCLGCFSSGFELGVGLSFQVRRLKIYSLIDFRVEHSDQFIGAHDGWSAGPRLGLIWRWNENLALQINSIYRGYAWRSSEIRFTQAELRWSLFSHNAINFKISQDSLENVEGSIGWYNYF